MSAPRSSQKKAVARAGGTIPEPAMLRRRKQAEYIGQLTGWTPDPAELGDFLHRIRRYPDSVQAWRQRLASEIRAARKPELPLARARALVDQTASYLRELATILANRYGSPDLGNKKDPVDELVYIVLSRKTREGGYQKAFEALKQSFATWDHLLEAPRARVESLVRPSGLASRKTASLLGALSMLRENFGSCSLEAARGWPDAELASFLCSMPEVNRKSAYCVMMYSMGREVFPVDTHVGRILTRLEPFRGLGVSLSGLDHKQLQGQLENLIPPPLRRSLHVNLVVHGREVCRARNPLCTSCEIRKLCHHYRVGRVELAESSGTFSFMDFFCGAGGLSAGLVQEGGRPVLALDLDAAACKAYRLNHPEIPEEDVILGDIRELSIEDIRSRVPATGLDLLVGGPPCQGFSLVGKMSKSQAAMRENLVGFSLHLDRRNYLFEFMMGAARVLKPRVVLMENVPGMLATRKEGPSFMQMAAQMLESAGYRTTSWSLEASAYGVPQRRKRVFLVGSLSGALPPMPIAEYQDVTRGAVDPEALDPVTLSQAICDLPAIASDDGGSVLRRQADRPETLQARRYYIENPAVMIRSGCELVYNHRSRYNNEEDLELYGLLEPGEDGRHVLEKYNRRDLMEYRTDVFDDKYSRLRSDHPSRTIVAHLAKDGNSFIHPEQVRSITVREAARIQSFSDHFIFCGSPSDQWIQVGNSVPPLLARAVARCLLAHLRRNEA